MKISSDLEPTSVSSLFSASDGPNWSSHARVVRYRFPALLFYFLISFAWICCETAINNLRVPGLCPALFLLTFLCSNANYLVSFSKWDPLVSPPALSVSGLFQNFKHPPQSIIKFASSRVIHVLSRQLPAASLSLCVSALFHPASMSAIQPLGVEDSTDSE